MSSAARRARRQAARGEGALIETQGVRPVGDSYQNFQARVGICADNVSSGGHYDLNLITRRRVELDYMYRGSWIVGVAVDAPPDDMTRAGIDFGPGIDPDEVETIQSTINHLEVWQQIADGVRWGRLYGGAIVVMLIDGQDYETPLRAESIAPGQFKGLLALDRWQLYPTYLDLVQDPGPHFGKPKYYHIVADATILNGGFASPLLGKKIHYTRCFRFEGYNLPFYQRMAEQGWGMSVLERLYDRLVAFDSTTQGAAQLVFKAHLRTLSIEGLRDIFAMGGPGEAALSKQVEAIRRFQSSEGLTLVDAKDKLEITNYGFSGLADMMLQFGQQIAGALQVPLVRLFGQSPAGLNSSGESDLRNYYDGINKDQNSRLTWPVSRLLDVLWRSEIGGEPDPGMTFSFKPLWQLTPKEKSEVAEATVRSVLGALGDAVIDRAVALKELRASSRITGIFGSITDKDIAAAEAEPPVPTGGDLPEVPEPAIPDDPKGLKAGIEERGSGVDA